MRHVARRRIAFGVAILAAACCGTAAFPTTAHAGVRGADAWAPAAGPLTRPLISDALHRCSNAKIKKIRAQIATTTKQLRKARTKTARKRLQTKLNSLNKQLKTCLKPPVKKPSPP